MKRIILLFFTGFILAGNVFAQFGQNKVQYKDLNWFYIQTKHFDIYFSKGGEKITEFAASVAEDALTSIQKDINYQINNRITLIVYNSHNDFQETNVTDEYTSQGTGGFTEPFKNRVVFPFEGSYQKFKHVIAHELVHAVMRDMYYGGTVQNIISKGITLQLPTWFWEGSAEFLSQGWETNSDMFIRNAITSESLPDINGLDGYLAYRGGQALFKFIADTYGRQKIGELMNKIQSLGGLEPALKAAIGINLEELNERWKKSLKKEYWPDIATRLDPDEFAKRLTDNKKQHGFYNTSPAISPQGDKIAFISDRDIYLNVYIMNAQDGTILKRVVESGKTDNFEELNILHPSLTWAPDNKRIALSSKVGGFDVLTIIDTETGDNYELPVKMDGIESVSWSHDGNRIAFVGQNAQQSDIYIYDFNTKEVSNLTADIFSDFDPMWTPDGSRIVFSSDRDGDTDDSKIGPDFDMYKHDYHELDLYSINVNSKAITRLTDWKNSDEKYPAVSADGKEIIFVSDYNGINNLYKKRIALDDKDTVKNVLDLKAVPITNSLNEITQPSLSYDGKKLVFTALYNLGYNIFMMNNPFDIKLTTDTLQVTDYMASLRYPDAVKTETLIRQIETARDTNTVAEADTGVVKSGSKIFTGQYISPAEKSDSTAQNYSRYVFGNYNIKSDSAEIARKENLFNEKLDDDGNFLVNKYKVNFSPDLIYANAGYSTLYGLLGTTVLSFSDVLGNHRLVGITSLQIDVKNSDYGLAYYYLKDRMNFGIEGYHMARFLYRDGIYGSELYRFRNFGLTLSGFYPIDRFHRIEGSLSYMSVTAENLDNPSEPADQSTYIIPSIGFVHDNTLWGYFSPIEGTRYSLTVFGNPGISKSRQSFYSLVWDYRNYFRFWWDNSFVIRLSGGYSGGGNPQRFFLGGTENWINRTFATGNVPIQSAADFAFLSPAMPLRGYDYAQKIGSKYALLNLELRMPLIRYLVTGPLPILFQNILGSVFLDAGTAWDNNKDLKLFGRDEFGNKVTQDLLMSTGLGFRVYMLFLWKLDIAWTYDLNHFSKPRYLISIGLDF